MKIELSQQVINNILIFLDRCEIKGFKEVLCMQEIINTLNLLKSNNVANNETTDIKNN